MTISELLSITISLLALSISGITAYRTLFSKFRPEMHVRPRIFIGRLNNTPCVILGCEISNRGALSGAVDDILLKLKYRQQDSTQGIKSISTYTFLPTLSIENYNIFKDYESSDFEPFQSIALSAGTRLTRYIVFSPSDTDGFNPSIGEIEIQLFARNSEETKWSTVNTNLRIPINDAVANIWKDPLGKSILLEAIEHNKLRENILEKISS